MDSSHGADGRNTPPWAADDPVEHSRGSRRGRVQHQQSGLTHPSGSGSPAQRHSRVSSSGWRALSPLERYLSHEGDPSPIGHATVNEHGALEEVEVDEGMEFHDAMEHAGGERDEYEQGYGGDDMYGAEVEGGEFGGGYHEPYPEDAYPGEMLQRDRAAESAKSGQPTLSVGKSRPGNIIVQRRQKGKGDYGRAQGVIRLWLRLDEAGNMTTVQMNKMATSRRFQVPLRDLRVLDANLSASYPCAILCREKAMVISMEQIKCIIGTHEIFVLNYDHEDVAPFVEDLQRRLARAHSQAIAGQIAENAYDAAPFELRCLEGVLESVMKHLEGLQADLEASAHPAMDALSHHVTTVNLERVRRIKSRMNRMKSRVESVREILEKYLNDDDDMLEMYLSRKAVIDERVHVMLEEQKSSSSEDSKSERAAEAPQPQSRSPLPTPGAAPDKEQPAAQAPRGASDSDKSSTSSWSTSTRSRSSIKGEVEEGIVDEVEMLLEAYFMQVDLLFNKLSTLAEYIDDTEDYVNIKQDNQRNQLLMLEIILTSATFCLAIISAIAGIFGMNLKNSNEESFPGFIVVTIASCLGAIFTFMGIIFFMRWRKLMLI